MLPTQQLSDLLLRYEELRQTGQSITPEELCRECPELVDEVCQRIAALAQVDNQLNLSTVDADDTLDSQKSFQPSTLQSIPGYVITHELARGGMGRVLVGKELALDRDVAIKTLLPAADSSRFITEARITARLPHPSIPPVYSLGTLDDGSPYLAMKLVRGQTLADP